MSMPPSQSRVAADPPRIQRYLSPPPLLAGAFVLVLGVLSAFLLLTWQPFYVPSASMLPTLLPGDSVIVRKALVDCPRFLVAVCKALKPELRQGDIIVFRLGEKFLIKRLIAFGGDDVAMRNGLLFINGTPVRKLQLPDFTYYREDGEIVRITRFLETLPTGAQYFTLYGYRPVPPLPAPNLNNIVSLSPPPGHYFVLGDDRDRSYDSRMSREEGGVGMVAESDIVGVARFILFSIRPAPSDRRSLSAIAAVRWNRWLQSIDHQDVAK